MYQSYKNSLDSCRGIIFFCSLYRNHWLPNIIAAESTGTVSSRGTLQYYDDFSIVDLMLIARQLCMCMALITVSRLLDMIGYAV